MVGLFPTTHYEEQSLDLKAGDLLLTYTDGVVEAMNEREEEWGENRMLLAVGPVRNSATEEIIGALFAAAHEFAGTAAQSDDMTLLLMKVI